MTTPRSGSCERESVTHALLRLPTQMHTQTSTHRRSICLHDFGSWSLCSSSASRRMIAVAVCEQTHILNLAFTLTLNLIFTLPPVRSTPVPMLCHSLLTVTRTHTPPQCFCRDLDRSSKALSTHASNCSQKAIALKVCTGQSGSGTYQGSPI